MNDKFLSLLGMARRASAIDYVEDNCKKAIVSHKAKLVIAANDASEKMTEKLFSSALINNIPCKKTDYSKQQLSNAIGTGLCAFITVNDRGFAESLLSILKKQ